ncbi:MAG: TetR/AcrR family transcriptional regulator, partial [Myxococcales bacterium]|nr:TetR/AcrR family transcriptional regulator [Myxococcales bacterium]
MILAGGTDKARTQESILVAATDLFVSNGYDGTTMRDIAEKAGVSRATVFWHFSDKASVFRETLNRMLAPFRASLERSWDEVPLEERLEAQLSVSEEFAVQHGKEIFAVITWALESPPLRSMVLDTLLDLNQRFGGMLAETVAELLPEEHEPRLAALAL